jgi:hypothetical protein
LSIFRRPPKKARIGLQTHPFAEFAANLQVRHADLTQPLNHEEIEEVITQGNNRMKLMSQPWLRLLCVGALALLSQVAHAQYSWIDDKGARVFSDRPPPPGTPAERILKAPRGLDPRPVQAETGAPAAAVEKPKAPTLAERDAEFRKRAAQREAEEQKAGQEASNKASKEESCRLARENERALSSGVRMARIDDKGERAFLTDEERAQRLERSQRTLKSCR